MCRLGADRRGKWKGVESQCHEHARACRTPPRRVSDTIVLQVVRILFRVDKGKRIVKKFIVSYAASYCQLKKRVKKQSVMNHKQKEGEE